MKRKEIRLSFITGSIVLCLLIAALFPSLGHTEITVHNTNAMGNVMEKSLARNISSPVSDFTYGISGSIVRIIAYTGSDSNVIIPDTIEDLPVKYIAGNAFLHNSSVNTIFVPASVTGVAQGAFGGCDNLTSITVDDENEKYSSVDGVLYNKNFTTLHAVPAAKTGAFTVADTVTAIGSKAFYYCYNLTSISMSNSVTTIGASAFGYCWRLNSVRLSDTLTSIGASAFAGCENLTSIRLPASISSIGADALLGYRDSNNNFCYNFIDGISCVEDSYAEDYVRSIGLTPIVTKDIRTNEEIGVSVCGNFATGTDLRITGCDSTHPDYTKALNFGAGKNFIGLQVFNLNYLSGMSNGNATVTVTGGAPYSASILHVYKVTADGLVPVASSVINRAVVFTVPNGDGCYAVVHEYAYTVKGDVNGDGNVTTDDARFTLRTAVGLDAFIDEQLPAGDVIDTGDGISTSDARKILRVATRLDTLD